MDYTVSPNGQWYHFDVPDAWAYSYKPSCGCVKYQAIENQVHVYVHPEQSGGTYQLEATLDDNDLLWNFRSCGITPDETETTYYFGLSKVKPLTETLIKQNSTTSTKFKIDTTKYPSSNYFWVAVPEKSDLTILDNLGHTLDGFGVDDNKTVEKVTIDGTNYLVYTRRSNIYISNIYTIEING